MTCATGERGPITDHDSIIMISKIQNAQKVANHSLIQQHLVPKFSTGRNRQSIKISLLLLL